MVENPYEPPRTAGTTLDQVEPERQRPLLLLVLLGIVLLGVNILLSAGCAVFADDVLAAELSLVPITLLAIFTIWHGFRPTPRTTLCLVVALTLLVADLVVLVVLRGDL